MYKLIPKAYGKRNVHILNTFHCLIACDIEPHVLNVPAVDTYRPRPKVRVASKYSVMIVMVTGDLYQSDKRRSS